MQNLISIYFIIITTAYLFHTIPLECLLGDSNKIIPYYLRINKFSKEN